jgi:hypothetical protein
MVDLSTLTTLGNNSYVTSRRHVKSPIASFQYVGAEWMDIHSLFTSAPNNVTSLQQIGWTAIELNNHNAFISREIEFRSPDKF